MLTLVHPAYTIDAPKKKDKKITPSRGLESKYARSLQAVADEVERIIKKYFTSATPLAATRTIQVLSNYSNKLFDWAKWTSSVIIYAANKDSEARWKKISRNLSRGIQQQIANTQVGTLLQEYLDDNVRLIASMPLTAAQRVHSLLMSKQLLEGTRAENLEEEIMRIGNITRNRARLIARTETSRITTGLTMTRAKNIGSEWYYWRTSEDSRVRSSHDVMKDVLVNWNDPPSPEALVGEKPYGTYHAGSTFNCRCYPEPVISITEDISFPVKVFSKGYITRMGRDNFIKVFGQQQFLFI